MDCVAGTDQRTDRLFPHEASNSVMVELRAVALIIAGTASSDRLTVFRLRRLQSSVSEVRLRLVRMFLGTTLSTELYKPSYRR